MTPEQSKQLRAILAHGDVRHVTFDASTDWKHVRVSWVIGGVWINESIQPDGSCSDRNMCSEDGPAF